MSEEADLIVKAIESLRSNSNWFKDYLFPIASSFLSAILGAFVAYFTLQIQEKNKAEREKIRICNEWTLSIEGLFQSLIAFKRNYFKEISGDPFQRALHVHSMLGEYLPIQKNVAELSFLIPTKDDPSSLEVKWRSLSRINGMISNYNMILQVWQKRNNVERPIREKLLNQLSDKAYADITKQQMFDIIGKKELVILIDLTEKAIHLTDDIIIEANSFLSEFPQVAKSLINLKQVKEYGRIIGYDNTKNDHLQKIIIKCPKLESKLLVDLYGVQESDIIGLYDNGY